MNMAIVLMAPITSASVVNAALGKLGLGGNMLSTPYALPESPETVAALACHWAGVSTSLTATIGQMLTGTLPTECLDEYDQQLTVVWGSPTEAEALAALATVTSKWIPYTSPTDYVPADEVNSMASLAGLVPWQDPDGGLGD